MYESKFISGCSRIDFERCQKEELTVSGPLFAEFKRYNLS